MKNVITQNRKGQALVESAFVLMIIVLFTYGITEFGRAMYVKNMLNNAARAGARQAVVSAWNITSYTFTNSRPPDSDSVKQKIYDSLMYVGDKSQVTANVECIGTVGCTGTDHSGATITVTVTYTGFDPVVTRMRQIISPTLVGRASMRYE